MQIIKDAVEMTSNSAQNVCTDKIYRHTNINICNMLGTFIGMSKWRRSQSVTPIVIICNYHCQNYRTGQWMRSMSILLHILIPEPNYLFSI